MKRGQQGRQPGLSNNSRTVLKSILPFPALRESYESERYHGLQVEVFWIVTPCSVAVGYQHFEGPFCSSKVFTLKMEAARPLTLE
jgi:hypothetical protein